MNTTPAGLRLSRRSFVKILAAAGITSAGGYTLFEYAPWLNYAQQAGDMRRPFDQSTTGAAQSRELVRYATLAASGHNAQPWKFAIQNQAIEIYPDYTRRLPVADAHDRELWISLGCALENLLVAAGALGYATEVSYPAATDVIRVRLAKGTARGSRLFDAIPLRQNTRSEYDRQPIKRAELDQLQAVPLEPGVALQIVTNPRDLDAIVEYLNHGDLSQYADPAFVDELTTWLRFNKKEAMATRDGLYTLCSGNPEVPRWLGQLFVAGTKPQQQADADAQKLRSSPAAIVVAAAADDKTAWVRTGQVYERLALTMTTLNIKSAFLNQPIEVAALRSQFQRTLGLGDALPQLLVRIGYANALPHSPRRPLEQVLV